jgi:hypothetical protein
MPWKGVQRMRKTLFTAVLILVLFPVIFPKEQMGGKFKIIEENGVALAINPDHPVPTKDNPKDISFTEEFRIGSLSGDPNYIFGEFIRFTVDDEGNVYVLDWREKTVKKYDRTGKFLLSFGGPGQGPGEFSFPEEIGFLPDGHLVVFEAESQKYTCFTKEGKVARTGRFQKLMYPPYLGFTNRNYLAMNVLRNPDKTIYTFGIFNEKSELLKPLHQLERESDPPWPRGNDPDSRARRFAETFNRIVFKPSTVLATDSREFIYFAYTDTFEIKVFRPDGQLNKIIKTNLPFLPVGAEDRQAFLEYHLPRDISTWNTMDKTLQNKIKSMIQFPDRKPALLSLIPMDNDYLMVVREGNYRQNALIDIFDSTGRFIIEKKLPFCIKDGICKGGRLYTIYEDDDGNQYVKCYRYAFI